MSFELETFHWSLMEYPEDGTRPVFVGLIRKLPDRPGYVAESMTGAKFGPYVRRETAKQALIREYQKPRKRRSHHARKALGEV